MLSARCSVRCAVSETRRRLATLCAVLLLPLIATAQSPVLRVQGGATATVEGVTVDGAAGYSVRTLETLGFRLATQPGLVHAVLGADTLRFWPTSPFFRAGTRLHQLTFAVQHTADDARLPEQFFIQWLPAAYPERFEFRNGAIVVKQPVVTQVGTRAEAAPQRTGSARSHNATRAPRVVVIDAGHGGRDPGKIGPNGLKEKDVALLLAQRLATVLRERGYEVHMTRTRDTLIALADRPRLANDWRGDRQGAVFLSIHANSSTSRTVQGFETFFLSEARTDDERRVAEMENEAIQFEDKASARPSDGLDQILNNLRSDFLMRASHDLAAVLQDKLAGFHPGPNRGVKRAGFYVLVGAIMPAVLIETAFISNRAEATLLGTQSFQQKIVWGIADSVDEYFRRNEHLWSQGP